MIKFTVREINDLLQQEINWCLDNPDPLLNKDQQLGFMNGIRQAQYLIRKAEQRLIEEGDD